VKRLVFRKEAEADLAVAAAFYEKKRPGLGKDLVNAVERALTAIADAPGAQPLFLPGRPYRKYTLARFPCVIVFREQEAEITALAVVHARRLPAGRKPVVHDSAAP
jgi:plasmid stabilization system protein ParE